MRRYRLRAVAVVAAAGAIAACYSAATSSSAQLIQLDGSNVISRGSGEFDFGTVMGMKTAMFTFSPLDSSDDYYIDSVDNGSGACTLFMLNAFGIGSGSSVHVYNSGSGSGAMCAQGTLRAPSGSGTNPGDCDYTFSATFNGAQNGFVQCAYHFTYRANGGSAAATTYTLTLDGTGQAPEGVSAMPSNVPLTTSMGTPIVGHITVANLGSSSNTVTASSTDTIDFSFLPTNQVVLTGSGGSQDYSVTCNAATQGFHTTTMSFAPTAGSGSSSTVNCNVLPPNGVVITSGNPVMFPLTLVHTPAIVQDVVANSAGGGTLAFALDGPAQTAGVTMTPGSGTTYSVGAGPGSGVTVTLHWMPNAPTNMQLGTLGVSLNGGSALPVTISGAAGTASVATTPPTIDFGPVCANSPAAPQSLAIYNTGDVDVKLLNITPPMMPFTVSPALTNATVVHGHLTEQMTSVSLTATGAGPLMSSLTLNLADPDQMAVTVPVHALALEGGITATPDTMNFGQLVVGATSNPQQFTLTNCGTGPLVITGHSITNAGDMTANTDFLIADPPAPDVTLQPAGKQVYTVQMKPLTIGQKSAILTLEHAGVPTTVTLIGAGGLGGGGSNGSDDQRQTYYACSTGQPGGLAPIALALLALRRRRRS